MMTGGTPILGNPHMGYYRHDVIFLVKFEISLKHLQGIFRNTTGVSRKQTVEEHLRSQGR